MMRQVSHYHLFQYPLVTGGYRGDQELLVSCTADLVVAAWGAKVPFGRDHAAINLFRKHFPRKPIYCLGLTKKGKPRHPLYVKSETDPMLFNAGERCDA
jgi:hypothetical protein